MDDAAASAGSSSLAATGTDAVEDDMNRLRQRKDELTQKHLDRERRKQQLRVSHVSFPLFFIPSSFLAASSERVKKKKST